MTEVLPANQTSPAGVFPHAPSESDADHVAEIGRAIQGARSFASMLPSAVVNESGVRALDYTAIERGERLPTGDELRAILSALGLSPDGFLPSLSDGAREAVERLLSPPASAEEEPAVVEADAAAVEGQGRARRRSRGGAASAERAVGEVPVTLSNIRACLAAFIQLLPRSKGELVYAWQYRGEDGQSPLGLVVKIYTSVEASTRRAYPVGHDAMRVLIFDERSGRKVEAWSSRINRVGDWPRRLRRLAGEAVMRATYRPTCPSCRLECVVSGPRGSQYWGCPNYWERKKGCGYRRSLLPLGEALAGGRLRLGVPEEGAVLGDLEDVRRPGAGRAAAAARAPRKEARA